MLVGTCTADDAGVYRVREDLAIVQTVDFFTAVVDDPYTFGQIAAANALSDIYAMGARPITALNVIAFPEGKMPLKVLTDILRGGLDKTLEARTSIIGGHTIKDDVPKYGLAVTGLVHPDQVLTNAGARPGDRLFLTKPIGSGIVATAIKQGRTSAEEEAEIIAVMAALNRGAADAMAGIDVHACTDVTGFGFLGHLHEMAEASGVSARVRSAAVPILDSARRHAGGGAVPGGSRANLAFVEPCVRFEDGIDEITRLLLADAQTSGGLLIAVAPGDADRLAERLRAAGVLAAEVGEITAGRAGTMHVLR